MTSGDTPKPNGSADGNVEPLPNPIARAVQLSLVQRLTAPNYRPPVLPAVAVRLVTLSRRTNVTTREIAELIEQDPVLAADMLRISQSAMMALSSPIKTVEEALVRLGIRRSTELFVQTALRAKLFRCRGYEAVMERLRRHSVATAEIARLVCELRRVVDDSAYLVGLLHDVGIAGCVLSLASKGSYLPPPPFDQAWPAIRGIHQRFALHLAVSWQLPKEIRNALMLHYGFENTDAPAVLTAITVLSEHCARQVGHGFEDEFNASSVDRARQILALSTAEIEGIETRAKEMTRRLE